MEKIVNVTKNSAEFIHKDNIHEKEHDKNLWNARIKRDKIAATIPEWEELRELASQIKEHTLSNLDHYLEMFEKNATKQGAIVHWASDAQEHNEIVYSILDSRKVTAIIKSKSMLQEECGMTPFLESKGIEVTETDLGERIQQLSGERPAHIVMPAIEKTTEDVAKLFAEKIGTDPNDDDPHSLAEAMRNNARPKFLKAGAGMTGANFAIAETGSFVVCTNEGNADIGASVPPIHIASIGIEKLLPKVEDLGVFIRLLSRSALGTPATQYTSHFTGPRQGSELHIILTDNGRSKRLGEKDFWHSLKCIRCGACMNTCPVYRRSGGLSYESTYSGPIGIILSPTFDLEKYSELPFHSSLCGSCSEVCPVKIDIADQIYKWREVVYAKGYMPKMHSVLFRAAGEVFQHPSLFRIAEHVGSKVLPLVPDFLIYSKLNPWTNKDDREMLTLSKETFRDWYLKNRKEDSHE
ncbi:lactate utilization protein B [Dysgonomonas sp. 25]|uniref:lactate utilization protein B n=1 Tax=Dysgonomonas sp. 25 TaxID=2302933 RepID=UPI0013D2741B|nr:lactate utilization protein B [Dysgonomonas sp. 25]NDV68235.1 lactate utilization protein [Dysgonomonas sp. 25]